MQQPCKMKEREEAEYVLYIKKKGLIFTFMKNSNASEPQKIIKRWNKLTFSHCCFFFSFLMVLIFSNLKLKIWFKKIFLYMLMNHLKIMIVDHTVQHLIFKMSSNLFGVWKKKIVV